MKKYILIVVVTLFIASCENSSPKYDIVCTTGMIGDVVKNLVGDSLQVSTLMGPGVDPHLYKATQGDIAQLSQARVIVYNGLHLEGKMGDIFHKLQSHKSIIKASDGIDKSQLINSTDFEGAYDPHIWFDVSLWMDAVQHISKSLQKEFPHLQASIIQNEKEYLSSLDSLHHFCITQCLLISENQRIMITAHDAFKYFGNAYNIKVKGLQGISTTAEYGLHDISELVNYIVENQIKAIFIESSVPQKAINTVIEGCKKRGHQVVLGGELYSDAMGAQNTPEGTYIGMVRHNVKTIVNALQ